MSAHPTDDTRASGGALVPPQFLRELAALCNTPPEVLERMEREAAARRLREDIRWAALTPMQRTLERIAEQRKRLARELRAHRRAFGLRIAGLTEDDIGGDW